MTKMAAVLMEATLELLGISIDPEKEGAFDVTMTDADALAAVGTQLVTFKGARSLLQQQYGIGKLKPGEALPEEFLNAINELGIQEIEVDLPAPITREQLRAVLKPGSMSAVDIMRLGPMLEGRTPAIAEIQA